MKQSRYSTFGHELHPNIALKAIDLFAERCNNLTSVRGSNKESTVVGGDGGLARAEVKSLICKLLPHRSDATRQAIANRTIQRFFRCPPIHTTDSSSHEEEPESKIVMMSPFVRLVSGLRDTRTRRQLLLWQLTQVEEVVGALSRELFFPFLVYGRMPKDWGEAEFRVVNGGQLMVVERYVTFPLVTQFAHRAWNFTSRPTLSRSLRILVQCGRLRTRNLRDVWRHPKVFLATREPLQLAAFIFGMYQEWLPTHPRRGIPIKNLHASRFAGTMLISPEEVQDLVRKGMRYGFFARGETTTSRTDEDRKQIGESEATRPQSRPMLPLRSVRLTYTNLDELVDAILDLAV